MRFRTLKSKLCVSEGSTLRGFYHSSPGCIQCEDVKAAFKHSSPMPAFPMAEHGFRTLTSKLCVKREHSDWMLALMCMNAVSMWCACMALMHMNVHHVNVH